MGVNLRGRSFLKLLDFEPDEIRGLIDLSARLKKEKKEGGISAKFQTSMVQSCQKGFSVILFF